MEKQNRKYFKCTTYKLFKSDLYFEPFIKILDNVYRIPICHFRTSNHRLPVEKGRWNKVRITNRLRPLCDTSSIGDEFPYLIVLICPLF